MLSKHFFSAIALTVFFSLSITAQTPTPTPPTEDDEVIKVDTALVNVPFSVSDRVGRNILGLKMEDFSLFGDGKPLKIEYLSTQDTPLNIVLLVDTSQSAQDKFDKIKNAANQFIKQLRPLDRCMIINFDESARVKSEFTNNQNKLDNALKRTVLSQKQGTLLRDAIFVTVDSELAKVKGRKAIILITDGKDAGSAISNNDLLHRLAESDAPIYSVFYETLRIVLPTNEGKELGKNYQIDQKQLAKYKAKKQLENQDAAEFLAKVSGVTGGIAFRKEIDNLGEAFNNIAEELRKQYLISFYPDEENYNIARHQIKVKVNKNNAIVRMKNYALLKSPKANN